MAEPDFQSAEDVCKIVAACRKAGVLRLTNGPLVVEFAPSYDIYSVSPYQTRRQTPPGASPTPEAEAPEETIRAEQQKIETLSIEEQEIVAKEQRFAELIIEDPLAAEEMMMRGELEKADGEPDGFGTDTGDDE